MPLVAAIVFAGFAVRQEIGASEPRTAIRESDAAERPRRRDG